MQEEVGDQWLAERKQDLVRHTWGWQNQGSGRIQDTQGRIPDGRLKRVWSAASGGGAVPGAGGMLVVSEAKSRGTLGIILAPVGSGPRIVRMEAGGTGRGSVALRLALGASDQRQTPVLFFLKN